MMPLRRMMPLPLVACLLLGVLSSPARGANDPKMNKLVERGLEWIASTQSRLGH